MGNESQKSNAAAKQSSILSDFTDIPNDASTEELLQRTRTQLRVVNALTRGFLNVFLADLDTETLSVLKLEGYVTTGLNKNELHARYSYNQLIETYCNERVHPEDRKLFMESIRPSTVRKALKDNDEYTGHYRIKVDGDIHYFQFRFIAMGTEEGERLNQVVAGFQNIDSIVAEEAKSRQALSDALIAAEHSNRAKTTFLNNMSHDIRTPMNAIIGFTSLAAAHIDNPDLVSSYLRKIQTSSNHLLSLINDVLDMSRIESGKMKIEEAEANLASIMHDLKVIVQSDIAAKQLDFFVDTVDIANENIICDKLRLNQVLLNLLSNAVKFTNPGGYISVCIAQKGKPVNGYANYEFRVKDSGIGIAPEFVDHVFEAFERERNSTVSGTQGTGLGMAITKNIVDMMGGTIEVHSELGKGTEFVVSLRFRTSETTNSSEAIPQLEGLRALVVDDNLQTCTSVAKMLLRIGMRADWTLSGKEAVYKAQFALEENDEYYAYIIDWLMPDMNGIERVRRIRAVIGDSKPIIVLTAYDWSNIEEEAREAGVTAFCSKPLFMSDLRDLLKQPLTEKSGESAKPQVPNFHGKRVLLTEDNELNREIALEILQGTGFTVDTALNGAEAVHKVQAVYPGSYDLVLMDIQMPVMDGYEATQAIREFERAAKRHTPILAMTANTFEEDKQRARDAGMDGHIAKPIEIPLLLKTLEEVFS